MILAFPFPFWKPLSIMWNFEQVNGSQPHWYIHYGFLFPFVPPATGYESEFLNINNVWCEEAIWERWCQWTTDLHICFLDLHTNSSSYWKSTQNAFWSLIWVTAWTLLFFLLLHVILEILQEYCDSSFVTDVDVALPVPLAMNISSRCQDLLWQEASMIVSIQSQILTDVSTTMTLRKT